MQALSSSDVAIIARWKYEGPYAMYDGRGAESARYMLDPRNGFYAVRGPTGLIGFCSFGIDARVPGGTYDDEALDIGAGMDPRRVGSGDGRAFLGAIVEHATHALHAPRLRATIASWNERALQVARSVGFRATSTFKTEQGADFTILVRPANDCLDNDDIPLTDTQRQELDHRLDALDGEGPVGVPWEEVLDEMGGSSKVKPS